MSSRSRWLVMLAAFVLLWIPMSTTGTVLAQESSDASKKGILDPIREFFRGSSPNLDRFKIFQLPGEGPKVRGIYATPKGKGPFPAIVLNHGGFDGYSKSFLKSAARWIDAGYAVAAPEYRGEGESEGIPDYAGAEVDDALRTLAWMRKRKEIDSERVAMVGYSRGGTVSLLAAARGAEIHALVAFAPVTRLEDLLATSKRARQLLEQRDIAFDHTDRTQVRDRDPSRKVGNIEVPLMIVQGGKDPLVPVEHSSWFVGKLRSRGIDAALKVFPEAVHHIKDYPGAFEAGEQWLSNRLSSRQRGNLDARLERAGLPSISERPYEGIRHGGIYQRMSYKDMTQRLTENIDNPLLAGIDFNIAWSALEPRRGEFQWSLLDRPLEAWGSAGKRCVVNIVTMVPRGASPWAGHATPEWVFEMGAKHVRVRTQGKGKTAGMTSDYPLLWDPVYLREYDRFVKAVAKRYDGHPSLDTVTIGIGKLAGLTIVDPKISPQERSEILGMYRKNGFSREKYFATIQEIARSYKRHFRKTPLRIELSNFFDKKDTSAANLAYFSRVADWSASQGIHLIYQGVQGSPKYRAKMKSKPIDAIFHRNAKKIWVGAEPIHPILGSNPKFMGTVGQNVDHAFGRHPDLQEASLTWMNFYLKDCRAANPHSEHFREEWWRAFHSAWSRLQLHP